MLEFRVFLLLAAIILVYTLFVFWPFDTVNTPADTWDHAQGIYRDGLDDTEPG